jgi:hypothetical protein
MKDIKNNGYAVYDFYYKKYHCADFYFMINVHMFNYKT